MEYTNYFGLNNKNNGQPRLSSDQNARYMNIVHLEGRIKEKRQNNTRSDFTQIFKLQRKLADLTGNLQPKELLEEMIHLSRNL